MKLLPLLTTIVVISCLTSCKKSVDPVSDRDKAKEYLVGSWKYYEITMNENENLEERFKITRRDDGSITNQNITIDHKDKTYIVDEWNGTWKVEGTYYFEEYPEWIDKFKIVNLLRDTFSWIILDTPDDTLADHEINKEEIFTEHRVTPSYTLPPPPEGYTQQQP